MGGVERCAVGKPDATGVTDICDSRAGKKAENVAAQRDEGLLWAQKERCFGMIQPPCESADSQGGFDVVGGGRELNLIR